MIVVPELLILPSEAAYLSHYENVYCRGVIETADGIRVFFKKDTFWHAFFESPNRDGGKQQFSNIRATRINWIGATLANPNAMIYQGWVKKDKSYDPTRRVAVAYEEFVVVMNIGLSRTGDLRATFITCYLADNSFEKISRSPLWDRATCLAQLTK